MSAESQGAAPSARTVTDLMSEDRHLSILIEAAPIAIVVADAAGRIALVNAQAEALFGYQRDELLGEAIERLIPRRFVAGHPALRDDYAARPAPRPMGGGRDLYCLRKDGSELPVEIGLSPIETPDGSFVLATVTDISERKHAEEERLSAAREQRRRLDAEADRDRALDASQLKSQFVATMSHELRTPLNAIIGITELLSRSPLKEPERGFVQTITESAEALLSIINGILDFSKIEAGKFELEVHEFSLEATVARAADVLFQQARQKNIALHVYVDPLIPEVLEGDADRLVQVLLNLVGNAIKFTQRGRVVVRVLPVESRPGRTTIRFEVEDTGVGIAADVLPRLFEPFVQGDGSASRSFGGTGLGLSISKRLVELMDGEIGVTSEPGSGSLFWFTIHLRVPRRVSATHRMSGVCVLIAIADESLAEIVAHYLDAWGMQSRWVRDRAAVDALTPADADGAGGWLVAIDNDDPAHEELAAAIVAHTGIDPRRIVPIGAHQALGKPLRQSALFDGLVAALNAAGSAATQAPLESDPAAVPVQDRRLSVLVAEDNVAMHEVLLHQFDELGANVRIVADGAQALAAITRENFDAVFMDCQMPNVDGFEATRLIRDAERRSGRHVPIIAMTANAFKEDREACLAAGMDDHLAKPVRLKNLREVLARWTLRRA